MKQGRKAEMNHEHMGTVLFESMISILCKQAVAIWGRVHVEGVFKIQAINCDKYLSYKEKAH